MATLRNKDEAFNWSGTGGAGTNWEEEIAAETWAAHVGNPIASDNVQMHGSHTVTITGTVACRSLRTESGFTGKLKQNTGTSLEVGDGTAPPENKAWNWIAGTYEPTSTANLKFVHTHTTRVTVHNGGQVPRTFTMVGKEGNSATGAGLELTDDLNGANEVSLEAGYLDIRADQKWVKFNGSTTKTREIRCNHKIVLTAEKSAAWTMGNTGWFHESEVGEIIELTGKEGTVKEGAGHIKKLVIAGDKCEATATVEVEVLEIAAGKTFLVKKSLGIVIEEQGGLISRGKLGELSGLESNEAGKAFKIKHTGSRPIIANFLRIKDSTAEGAGEWYAGANSENVSGNTTWKFEGFPFGGASTSKVTTAAKVVGTGSLAGTINNVFSTSSTLVSKGKLGGSIIARVTATAPLVATGALAAATVVKSQMTGTLAGTVPLGGVATVRSVVVAAVTGHAGIVGSTTSRYSAGAAIVGTGGPGAAAITRFTGASQASGTASVTGTTVVRFGNAVAVAGRGGLRGSIASKFTASGTTVGVGGLRTATAVKFVVESALHNAIYGSIASRITIRFTATAALSGRGGIAGTSTARWTQTATLGATGGLASTTTVRTTLVAAATGQSALGSAVMVRYIANGNLEGHVTQGHLTGDSVARIQVHGAMRGFGVVRRFGGVSRPRPKAGAVTDGG